MGPIRRCAVISGLALFVSVFATARANAQERRLAEEIPNAYRDITSVGADTGIKGESSGLNVNIGFPFTFYGQSFTTVTVTTKGYLCFDQTLNPLNDTIFTD